MAVCGSFGYGNVGDEAVPLALADLAESLGAKIDLRLITRFQVVPGTGVHGTGNMHGAEAHLRSSLVFAGGGIIEPGHMGVLRRCREAALLASRCWLFAASADSGVSYRWIDRLKTWGMLRRFDGIYMRDILSAEVLRRHIGLKRVQVIGDSVLWLRRSLQIPVTIPFPSYIVVNLCRRWAGAAGWHECVIGGLKALARATRLPLVFVPLCTEYDDDRIEHRAVAKGLQAAGCQTPIYCLEESLSPRQVMTTLSGAKLAVSMRLHGCVMAFASQVPFVGIGYHSKLYGFAQTVGWEQYVLPRIPPCVHSPGAYGYSFCDLSMDDRSIEAACLDAMAYADFRKLGPLRTGLAEVFSQIVRVAQEN